MTVRTTWRPRPTGAADLAWPSPLPPDLRALWDRVESLRVAEDVTYGQWGLIIWAEAEAYQRSLDELKRRPGDYVAGDVVVGEFLGDSQLVVVRCDLEARDFGMVSVALPIDPRPDWPDVSASILEFIARFSEVAEYWWSH